MEDQSAVPNKPKSSEVNPGPGFRIKVSIERVDQAVADQFREFATPDISDQLNRLYAATPRIRCLTGSHHQLAGPLARSRSSLVTTSWFTSRSTSHDRATSWWWMRVRHA